jgi:transketolase
MSAICNGIAAHGALRPYCATVLNFVGYALGAVRLSALSELGVLYVMTHDSIGLGEDGPTHQPIETLEQLRALPNLFTIRPADGNETVGAYTVSIEHPKTPVIIALSRQAAPTVEGTSAARVAQGGYTVQEFGSRESSNSSHPTLILVATGTEVHLAVNVAREVHNATPSSWIRVVSMPCTELFDQQPLEYQKSVLTGGSPIVSIEAAGVTGWRKYAHVNFGIDNSFGMSAPGDHVYAHFGLTKDALTPKVQEVIKFYTPSGSSQPVAPSLLDYPRFAPVKSLH